MMMASRSNRRPTVAFVADETTSSVSSALPESASMSFVDAVTAGPFTCKPRDRPPAQETAVTAGGVQLVKANTRMPVSTEPAKVQTAPLWSSVIVAATDVPVYVVLA